MKYVIIGGGIAGATLAILLQRKGFEVVVAERIPLMLSSIPTALGLIQSGQLRAIAVSALERSLRSRNRLLEEQRPDTHWLDAIEHETAELAVAVAAGRREVIRGDSWRRSQAVSG